MTQTFTCNFVMSTAYLYYGTRHAGMKTHLFAHTTEYCTTSLVYFYLAITFRNINTTRTLANLPTKSAQDTQSCMYVYVVCM